MKWILVTVGLVAALVLLVVVIGATLPRDHVAAMSARIAASPDAVWRALTDPPGFPSWRHDVRSIEMLPATATGPSWREHSRSGAITYVIDAFEPPRRLVGRIADSGLAFGGTWEYRIEPEGTTASRVTIVERGSVHNPVFRFVSRYVMGHTATIDGYLRALGRRYGPEPTPEVVKASLLP
jgi:uncharacterized protein YndB with AHSA1/START domain